jgi:hypothetical protein
LSKGSSNLKCYRVGLSPGKVGKSFGDRPCVHARKNWALGTKANSISPVNDRFIYQCDVPFGRYQFQQVRRSFNRDDAQQWLMEHNRKVFADWLAAAPEPE